ncbi:biotin/lipoyl-containing protein [Cumulibacter soli]|uniref:biotin/lipoyl-containing protein n=1 Tax=Cumulibacter soli TaxID=2546344 RepID=UPI001067BB3C|nr:biotin/lipoyl-containing protein [Cumulibacter soli]
MKVEADVSGSVVEVHVAVGAEVASGTVLVTLESMKMEVPIESTSAGTIESVGVAVGDLVDEGDTVAVLR